jgi:hypothetical protein
MCIQTAPALSTVRRQHIPMFREVYTVYYTIKKT